MPNCLSVKYILELIVFVSLQILGKEFLSNLLCFSGSKEVLFCKFILEPSFKLSRYLYVFILDLSVDSR